MRKARPKLLDLFCGAGGAAMGYHRAGFDVTGVDIAPQPHYPFTFYQHDAFKYPLYGFDAVHASPPCQAYSQSAQGERGRGKVYPDLLGPTRDRLESEPDPRPWVIENVPKAPMRADLTICGCQVGLDLRRVRWFESNITLRDELPAHHHPYPVPSVVGHGTPTWVRERLGYKPTIADYRRCMGIDWMNRNELSQSIPPAYTEYIGHQLLEAIK